MSVIGGWKPERDDVTFEERLRAAGYTQGFAEGIEAAARWHEEQALHHYDIASSTRENWTGSDIGEDDRRDNLRYARENDSEAGRHERYAKVIRALVDEPVGT